MMAMKRSTIITLVLTLFILAVSIGVASASTVVLQIGQSSMTVDGMKMDIDPGQNTSPAVIANRTFVPIRAIVEALGGSVAYTAADQRVDIQLEDTSIALWIGKPFAIVNGQEMMLETSPFVSATSRTMLPLRFVVENLGGLVVWDGDNQRITIARGESKPNVFTIHMSGEGITPSKAVGEAILKVSNDGNSVVYSVIVADIENVNMAHIHIAATAGGTGPPAVWLYPSAPPPVLLPGRTQGVLAMGTCTSDSLIGPLVGKQISDLITALNDGTAYVNVHTTAYPDGEIRGYFHTVAPSDGQMNSGY